ncbi:protease inhibitor 1 precursor [Danaus plexippus plexippus]|uniref:Protease inhibitor 1 n=1 Tax=Danaus plexippus plexippus TaxID=278856 RepID=A0A212EH57_DANPL|nr:protease inhibitor 1 precursor [Danaus plexippus plexippus]
MHFIIVYYTDYSITFRRHIITKAEMKKILCLMCFGGIGPTPGQTETPGENTGRSDNDCRRSCPVTAEYNPVCGSDNVTYPNPSILSCAQACGVNVTLARPNRCTVTTPAPN